MKGQSIVAGVDISPEGAWAAATAWRLARAAKAPCHLVYVVQGTAIPPGTTPGTTDNEAFRAAVLPVAREQVRQSLMGNAPPECADALEIWFGPPGEVLARIAAQRDAALLVVGGKHHSRLDRWLAGSTALDTVRAANVPILVATGSVVQIRRILVAVDFSAAARRTVQTAWRLAELTGAELRVLHAVERLSAIDVQPTPPETDDPRAAAAATMERMLPSALTASRDVGRLIRPGWAWEVITQEARQWDAQLVVFGSHRKDWVDRAMLGSVTEALLRELPTSLLVVPPRRGATAQGPIATHTKTSHSAQETFTRRETASR